MKTDPLQDIQELKELIRDFCEKRDWDQFHSPKDLAIGLATESAELLELFRFKSNEEIERLVSTEPGRTKVAEELADVFYFLLRFGQKYQFDLTTELVKKLEINDKKYPVDKARGSNKKYNEL
ncbi:MAG: nucleotide pyrophosphohydrolase [Bdellovibrionales bacterium]